MACVHSPFLLVPNLKMMCFVFMNLMFITWLADFFLIIIFLLILILSACRVTFVGAIRLHITILDFKRPASYIIFFDSEAL